MKKIIITFIVSSISLFSCDNFILSSNKEKLNFSGKDCKPYNLGFPPVEKFTSYNIGEKHVYLEKSSIIKPFPYLGKIKIYINESIISSKISDKIEINIENKYKIDELEKIVSGGRSGIKINNVDIFYFYNGYFRAIFNNSCEYDFFKSKVSILNKDPIFYGLNNFELFSSKIDITNEKIEIEKIETLLKEYNKYYLINIKEIEFSSINALKTFLLFIKLTTQEPIFYKDLEIEIFTHLYQDA
ncbi:MAG: hypothetical protein AABZ74_06430 [Cyanobacteriota bacterium]